MLAEVCVSRHASRLTHATRRMCRHARKLRWEACLASSRNYLLILTETSMLRGRSCRRRCSGGSNLPRGKRYSYSGVLQEYYGVEALAKSFVRWLNWCSGARLEHRMGLWS
jgi:hypothetical protein